MNTRCSWCLAETNTPPNPSDSHTICERHRAQVLAEYGIADAVDVARTYKELRVERNDTLEDYERSQRIMERVNRTVRNDLIAVGVSVLGGAMVLGFAWLLWLTL